MSIQNRAVLVLFLYGCMMSSKVFYIYLPMVSRASVAVGNTNDVALSLSIPQMNNPAIQNDLSYFRRTRNRLKMDDSSTMLANGGDIELPDDVGNRMSLFYANPTPMLNTISMATTKFTQEVRCLYVCVKRMLE